MDDAALVPSIRCAYIQALASVAVESVGQTNLNEVQGHPM
jgi:hypothetical protein